MRKKDALLAQHTAVANQLLDIREVQLKLSVPRGSFLHYRVWYRTGKSLNHTRDAYVPITINHPSYTGALVPVEGAPWFNARCICERDSSATNRPNAPLKLVPLIQPPRARLALESGRTADLFGFPAHIIRHNEPSRVDHRSRGTPKALSQEEDGRRVAVVAEPKQSNCELYTDGTLRTVEEIHLPPRLPSETRGAQKC